MLRGGPKERPQEGGDARREKRRRFHAVRDGRERARHRFSVYAVYGDVVYETFALFARSAAEPAASGLVDGRFVERSVKAGGIGKRDA